MFLFLGHAWESFLKATGLLSTSGSLEGHLAVRRANCRGLLLCLRGCVVWGDKLSQNRCIERHVTGRSSKPPLSLRKRSALPDCVTLYCRSAEGIILSKMLTDFSSSYILVVFFCVFNQGCHGLFYRHQWQFWAAALGRIGHDRRENQHFWMT